MRHRSAPSTKAIGNVVRMSTTEHFRLSERFYPANSESPPHSHIKSYIIITLDGRYYSTFETKTEEFRPWTVSFHREGVLHTSKYPASGAKVLYVEVPPEHLDRFMGPPVSHLNTVVMQGGLTELTARQLYQEFTEPDDLSPVVLDGLVLQLFAQLCRRRKRLPHSLPTWLGRAAELIRSRFTEQLGLEEIARAVHVHPAHLAREYRRHYNCTIGEQIRRLRIEYACEELSAKTRSLADIALAAGFSDQSHFTVSFKKQIGTSPSQYRRSTQNDAIPAKES